MAAIPSQRQRCAVHEWCTSAGRGHRTHVSQPHVLTTVGEAILQVSLTAEDEQKPVIHLEAAFAPGQVLMEISDLEPAAAIELAGLLLRLARTAHIGSDQGARNNTG